MKAYLLIPVYILFLATPTSLVAQTVIGPSTSWKSYIDSTLTKPDLTLKFILPSKPDTTFPYQQHLNSKLQYKKPDTYQALSESPYQYNMPVMKPGKTSKILIAKLDPDFPYHYSMPVLKHGNNKE